MWFIYSMEFYSAIKNEILPFAAIWMDLEDLKLNEIIQTERHTVWYHLHVESKKLYKWTDLQNRNRFTDIENNIMVTKGEEGRDKLGVWN